MLSTISTSKYILLSLPLINTALGATYTLSKSWQGNDFFDGFTWWEWDDPTQGRVNYVNQETAISRNLSYVNGGNFIMRADSTNVVDPSARGRDSVRIHSKDTYTDGNHGCQTYAYGMWYLASILDMYQSWNMASRRRSRYHRRDIRGSGTPLLSDCTGGVGCGVRDKSSKSFGEEFNKNEGGIFVMRRSKTRGFSFWFWPHNSPQAPTDITSGSQTIMESLWSTPVANFPADQCDINSHFDDHEIIINLTFAGVWAGGDAQWAASGCAGTAGWTPDDYVNKNPQAFTDAYWEIRSLRWYTPVCTAGARKRRLTEDQW
ncbi:hypothetical protein V865_007260 [Kwoniella europaea PYCC6329]|uniref:GH16 domain-containing protein n=1 Tax=Kwoniella europaea PYCC6329 TaxID=1423913 RepID=A0AAX4KTQ5_9TREE